MPEYTTIHGFTDFENRKQDSYLRILDDVFFRPSDIDLPVETWDMSECESMKFMFLECYKIPEGISTWDVSKCINMTETFNTMSHNRIPDISGWDVSACYFMRATFAWCSNIPPGIFRWDISGCHDLREIFYASRNIPNISAWDTSKCEVMEYMFARCRDLNQPLSFNIKNVIYCEHAFYGCHSLKI